MANLCIDCKWYKAGSMYHWCRREVHLDLVTGQNEAGIRDCEDERSFTHSERYCGPEGRYWEPIEKVLPRGEDLVEVFKPIKKARTRRAKPRGTKVN